MDFFNSYARSFPSTPLACILHSTEININAEQWQHSTTPHFLKTILLHLSSFALSLAKNQAGKRLRKSTANFGELRRN